MTRIQWVRSIYPDSSWFGSAPRSTWPAAGPAYSPEDGEIVVIHKGRTDFSALQAELSSGWQGRLLSYALDLLYLEGFDLRRSQQLERKRS